MPSPRYSTTSSRPTTRPMSTTGDMAALRFPYTLPLNRLFEKVNAQVVSERSKTNAVFTLYTKEFEDAAQLLNTFRLTVLPLNLYQLRHLPEPPDFPLPTHGEVLIQFLFDDLPGVPTPFAQTVLSKAQQHLLMRANIVNYGFFVKLEMIAASGVPGKARSEIFRYEPYVLDWEGWEGFARVVRTRWGLQPEVQDNLLQALQTRRARGVAAGLNGELGRVHHLKGQLDQALYWYHEEMQHHLKPDNRLGWNAHHILTAMGQLFKQCSDLENALRCLRLALHLNPNSLEALLESLSLLPADGQRQALGRLFRLYPDEPWLTDLIENECHAAPAEAIALQHSIRSESRHLDLTRHFVPWEVDDQRPLVQHLLHNLDVQTPAPEAEPEEVPLAETATMPALSTEELLPAAALPPLAPVLDTAALSVPLAALDDAVAVLKHFAAQHDGLQRRPVRIEEMVEYRRDKHGQLSVNNTPGAVLQLALQPELVIRVTLRQDQCTVRLMQEVPLPGTNETGLKSMRSDKIAAHGGVLFELLNSLLHTHVLVREETEWHYRAP